MIKQLYFKLRWLPANIKNKIVFFMKGVSVGEGTRVLGPLFIRGTGKIVIGDNVVINSCVEANPIGGSDKSILYAKGNGTITIGDNVGISNSAIVALSEITIEDNVFIGGGCKIYDNDFHSLVFEHRMMSPDPGVKMLPITIKNGVFVGAHSIILKGVEIGSKSIIAAGSVVTKSIPECEIWGGNPAKFLKKVQDN